MLGTHFLGDINRHADRTAIRNSKNIQLDPDQFATFTLQPLCQLVVLARTLLQLPEERSVDLSINGRSDIQGRKCPELILRVTDHGLIGRIGRDKILVPVENCNTHELVRDYRLPSLLACTQFTFELSQTLFRITRRRLFFPLPKFFRHNADLHSSQVKNYRTGSTHLIKGSTSAI